MTKIGRNLNRCLIIDNLADNFKLQPNNGIQCGTWIDDMKDTQLNDIDIILTQIIERKPQDIKPIIKRLNDEINKKMKGNTNLNPFKDIDVTKLFKWINNQQSIKSYTYNGYNCSIIIKKIYIYI